MASVTQSDPVWTALSLVLLARGPGAFATVKDFVQFVVDMERELGARMGMPVELDAGGVLARWEAVGGFPPLQELEAE